MNTGRSTGKAKAKLVAVPNISLGPKGGLAFPTESKEGRLDHKAFPTIQEAKNVGTSSSKSRTAERAAVQAAERAANEMLDKSAEKSPETSGKVAWEYDVYATPFVPSHLQAINLEEPGAVVRSRSRHWLNYPVYTATFAGSSFLPERPTNVPELGIKDTDEVLTARSYFHRLTALWELECTAKALENKGNSMYKVVLGSGQHPNNRDPMWIMSVPGLRDDDPFLEKGDVLQLRQLWVDATNNLMLVPMQIADRFGFTHLQERCWTGVQYNAIILSVNRRKELVYLQAEGLAPLSMGNLSTLTVNATIPMKHSSLEAQRMSLVRISVELEKVRSFSFYLVVPQLLSCPNTTEALATQAYADRCHESIHSARRIILTLMPN